MAERYESTSSCKYTALIGVLIWGMKHQLIELEVCWIRVLVCFLVEGHASYQLWQDSSVLLQLKSCGELFDPRVVSA